VTKIREKYWGDYNDGPDEEKKENAMLLMPAPIVFCHKVQAMI
jgi:hypothetical protein